MTSTANIWVLDDERSIRWVLEKALEQEGLDVTCFEEGASLLKRLKQEIPDLIISDIRMPDVDGLELLAEVKEFHPDLPVIVMTAHSDLESAVSSIKGGAYEYLPKPFAVDEVVNMVKKAITQQQSPAPLETQIPTSDMIIGKAPAMQAVFRAIGRLSKSSVTVLINGQSGTGKELVALALHQHSPRNQSPFVALNMAAIPGELIESELFGHEKGSFTGANERRRGRFEQAEGGTLFLDEIGDMPPDTQTRLLRVLSDGQYYRVGGTNPLKSNVRIIAATHQDLESLVNENKFREDLYHRLNVIRIHLPTLAQRNEDIPLLTEHFLHLASKELAETPKIMTPEAIVYLTTLPWPGNVRQLENFCRWITVMAPGQEVLIEDLPAELLPVDGQPETTESWEKALRQWTDRQLAGRKTDDPALLDIAVPKFERIMIQTALKYTGGRKRDASILLGWGRNTLTRKIKELELDETNLLTD